MPKGNYVCPTCGYEDIEPGICPDCSMELEQICPECGNPKKECMCDKGKEEEEENEEVT